MRSLSNTGEDSVRDGRIRRHRIFPSFARSATTAPGLPLPRLSSVTNTRPLPYAGEDAASVPSFAPPDGLPVRLSIACSAPLFLSRNSLPSAMIGENSSRIDPV